MEDRKEESEAEQRRKLEGAVTGGIPGRARGSVVVATQGRWRGVCSGCVVGQRRRVGWLTAS